MFVITMVWMMSSIVYARTIQLHDPKQIHDAEIVDKAIGKLSDTVMRCVQRHGGKTKASVCRDECSCQIQSEYRALKDAFNRALKQHPVWAGNTVFFEKPNDPRATKFLF